MVDRGESDRKNNAIYICYVTNCISRLLFLLGNILFHFLLFIFKYFSFLPVKQEILLCLLCIFILLILGDRSECRFTMKKFFAAINYKEYSYLLFCDWRLHLFGILKLQDDVLCGI